MTESRDQQLQVIRKIDHSAGDSERGAQLAAAGLEGPGEDINYA